MSKLVITDLNFCSSDFPDQRKLKGSASFFDWGIGWSIAVGFDPSGQVGTAVATGLFTSKGNKPLSNIFANTGVFLR